MVTATTISHYIQIELLYPDHPRKSNRHNTPFDPRMHQREDMLQTPSGMINDQRGGMLVGMDECCGGMDGFNSLYYSVRSALMAQNRSLFSADLQAPPATANSDFKKERALYLAERKARQREAQQQRRREFGRSSSSEEEVPETRKQPVLIKENFVMAGEKTDSSGGSPPPPPPESLFKAEREKYKMQRMARRQQAVKNRKLEFGSSSSSDDEIPTHPRVQQQQVPPRMEVSPRQAAFRQEDTGFGFVSLDLTPNRGDRGQKSDQKEPSSAMLATVRLKDKKQSTRERYEVETLSSRGNNIWTEQTLEFRENSLALGNRTLPLYDISKAKMIFEPTQTGCYRVKLTVGKEEVFFAASHRKMNEVNFLDMYYFLFAKVIALKLQIMGRKAVQPQRGKNGIALNEKILRQARLVGKVRKNSFFGGWQDQTAVVSSAGGLAIYKDGKEKASLVLVQGSVKEIWTRFEFERENLILKFLNGSSKVELSVPVENFMTRENWLYQLYALTPR